MSSAGEPTTRKLSLDLRRDTAILSSTNTLPTRWLPAIRIGWALIFGMALFLFVAGIPYQVDHLLASDAFSPAALASSSISPQFAAWFDIALDILQTLVFGAIAAFLYLRRPGDWITLFASLMLITFGVTVITGIPDRLPEVFPAARIPVGLLEGIGNGTLVAFLYTFPDGRFVPRWTRWVAASYGVWAVLSSLFPQAPFSLYAWPTLLQWAVPMTFYLGAVPVQEWRRRHHFSQTVRQQAKWIHAGLGAALAGFCAMFGIEALTPALAASVPLPVIEMFKQVVLLVTLTAIPIGIAISILRYRLWDLDFILNRSLIYGTLTLLLIGLFVGLVLVIQEVLERITGGHQSPLALAASTVAVGLFFQPARRLLRRVVDQKVFGIYLNYHSSSPLIKVEHAAANLSGKQLGVYIVEEPLGRGGMADVYKGRHATLPRPVAIKVLPPTFARDEDFIRRFEREAQTIALLRHPNIVGLYDFGVVEGTYYMVMEYIAGRDLGDVIRESAPMPLEQILAYVRDVAGALDYAHGQGVVHRDVKPSNVMLQPATAGNGHSVSERAILTDFGIAKMLTAATRLTQSGVVGTFDYIAPEQIRDEPTIDGRADVYSLGVMAFQMLTGKLPFSAAHPGAMLLAHLQQPAPDPRSLRPDLPHKVSAVVLRALEKQPRHRFDSAGEFAAALS